MLTKLKRKVQAVLAREATAVRGLGLTPNMISVASMISASLSALAYAAWRVHPMYLLLATALLLLSGFCDALDGAMARLYGETTLFGGFLDSTLDRYADAIVYTGIIISGLGELPWGLAALIGSLLVSYTRARAEAAGIEMESTGLAERAERMIILAAASVTATLWLPALNMGVVLLAILSNLTVLQRSLHVYRKLKDLN